MYLKRILVTVVFLVTVLFCVQAFSQQYDLLIIAPYEFVDELQPLKNWKDETGRPTIIVSLGEIEEKDYGEVRDQPEQIKRFIEEYVRNHNVKYVMLVGDSDKFPVRYIKAYNTEWGDKYYPSDLYYMDLYDSNGDFDDWDGDGDDIIGEMDFTGGTNIANVNLDNINMYPDVAVARVPASTESEVSTYVNKVMDYEHLAPGTWFNDAYLVVGDWGGDAKMDAIVTYLGDFTTHKRYMSQPPWDTMNDSQRADEMNNFLNAGTGLVLYHGHGNRDQWSHWYYQNKMGNLTNNNMLPVMFATACYTGRFHFARNYYLDKNGVEWNGGSTNFPEPMAVQPSLYDTYENESLAEHFLVKRNTGAIGYIGCTSKCEHGAWLDPTKGLSPYFLEAYDNGTRVLGDLWKKALNKFIIDLEDPITGGMHYYAFIHIHKMILFGDPSLAVGGLASISTTPDIKANGSDGPISLAQDDSLSVTVSLDAGNNQGTPADWWLAALTPYGLYFFTFGGWVTDWLPAHQGPLFPLPPLELFNFPLSGFPAGIYILYFGVDTNMDNSITWDSLYCDTVVVNITE